MLFLLLPMLGAVVVDGVALECVETGELGEEADGEEVGAEQDGAGVVAGAAVGVGQADGQEAGAFLGMEPDVDGVLLILLMDTAMSMHLLPFMQRLIRPILLLSNIIRLLQSIAPDLFSIIRGVRITSFKRLLLIPETF